MAELAGTWIYRRFNPAFVKGNLTPQEDALTLAGDDVVLTLEEGPGKPGLGVVEGTIEWAGGGLNLKGTVLLRERVGEKPGYVGEPRIFFEMVGTGRPGTDTDGWEYRYHGQRLGIPLPRASDAALGERGCQSTSDARGQRHP